MITKKQQIIKRSFDIVVSLCGLLLFVLPIIILCLIASRSTKASGFFTQKRVGLNGKNFTIYKIRSMRVSNNNSSVTTLNDDRTTSFGRFLRNYKFDELPQLYNVFIGDMSIVGPRPDVPDVVDTDSKEVKEILKLRPGITGLATLYFKNEEFYFKDTGKAETINKTVLFPRKVRLNKIYLENWSFCFDLKIIIKTIF